MQARRIILALAGVAVLGLVGLLLLEVNSDSEADIPADKKQRALAEYQRRNRLNRPPPPAPEPDVGPARVKRPEPEEKVEEAPPPDRSERSARPGLPTPARAVQLKAPAVKLSTAKDPETTERIEGVRSAYDSGDYPQAQKLALEAVQKSPRHIKVLRYVVASSCAVGDVDVARQYAERLPKRDRSQMTKKCAKWGADL